MFRVNLVEKVDFKPGEAEKLSNAVAIWEKVWNSPEFQHLVLNFGYYERVGFFRRLKYRSGFRLTQYNSKGVLDFILSGSEILSPEKDGEADIALTIDRRTTESVIGYTYPATKMQWIYSKFFNSMDVAEIAGNLAHEYCHKLGFEHEFNPTALRQYTVPYAIGYMTRDLARKM
jgi:hypothetical protein